MSCPICGTNDLIEIDRLHDDRYGYPGEFSLKACRGCAHLFLDCTWRPDELAALYSTYYPRARFSIDRHVPHTESRGFLSWLAGDRRSAFRWVPQGVRVLDIGCGFGESLGYHKARGCEVHGVEADENIRRVAEKFGYNVHVGLFDAGAYDESFFDFVTMDQVIEHVTDPRETLRGVARILKPGGSCILSTPNARGWGSWLFGRRWINWHAPYHLHFFSRRSLSIAATQAGLLLAETRTITSSEWLHYQLLHLVQYPNLGAPSRFWLPGSSKPTLFERISVRALGAWHKTHVNHVLTRIFDGLGMGDNFVFVLKKP